MITFRQNRALNFFLGVAVTLAAGLGHQQEARAVAAYGTVDLVAAPPDITASVAPNLVLTFDDSGSMANTYMPDTRPYDGAGWGNPFLCAGVIDPRVLVKTDPRSRAMNGVYYNPNVTYRPPLLSDGVTPMPTPSFTTAWDNGILQNRPNSPVTQTTRNLTTYTGFCGQKAGYYRYLSTAPALTVNATTGKITNTATLYTAANWEYVPLPAAEQTNFAIWYSYYRNRNMAAISAISRAYAPFDQNIRVAWQNINTNFLAPGTTKIFKFADVPAVYNTRVEFYKWLFAVGASGNTPNQAATVRTGNLFKQAGGLVDTNPYYDRDLNLELSCRQNFHILMTDGLWNNATVAASPKDTTSVTLPDGRAYSNADSESKIIWNETATAAGQQTMADLGFMYWANDARPDFQLTVATKLRVPPFLPDQTTGVTGSTPLTPGSSPLNNKEIYWNPNNDPATWPHVVQFPIGFGVSGTIPRNDTFLTQLRKGLIQWPAMSGTSPYTDTDEKIDDMWHMAINSRGDFFAADSPDALIQALNDIVASIIARRGASTAATAASSVLSQGSEAYRAGYDSADWSGFATKHTLDPNTGVLQTPPLWDGGCILTGGACPSGAPTATARDPNSRVILTSDGTVGTGKPFRWASLSAAQQTKLNANPASLDLSGATPTFTADGFGAQRVDYFRGVRTNETTASPTFRKRSSVLGAVVNAQPTFVSSPKAGWRDIYPVGSPEQAALPSGSYAIFQAANASREQIMYTAADDGMLHAFRGDNGSEAWAYVPNALIDNFRLTQYSRPSSGLISTVDDSPLEQDVFINGAWRTVLVGSLRLGGRGVYALNVTNPIGVTEATGSPVPMWEFTNKPPASSPGADCAVGSRWCSRLGYTYDAVNIARLTTGKWVALVSSGYFPTDTADYSSTEAAASQTSLLVIDIATGTLIQELKTSTAPEFVSGTTKTYGLSSPLVYDFNGDQIDDIAVAGDLAGNLWRFDLTANKVNLMFQSYGNGGAAAVGDQPISSMPIALNDKATRKPIFIFGTGKLLGRPDRTSAIPQQAFYGIRDYGTATSAGTYPVKVSELIQQTITEDANGVRTLTQNPVPFPANKGWKIPLNIVAEKGERSQRTPFPLYSANLAILYSVIPKGDDPCNPGNRYGVLVVAGSTGGMPPDDTNKPPATVAGVVVDSSTPLGNPVVKPGGRLVIPLPSDPPLPSAVIKALDDLLATASLMWHRGAWRELQQDNN